MSYLNEPSSRDDEIYGKFSSIEDALMDIRDGKFVIVLVSSV